MASAAVAAAAATVTTNLDLFDFIESLEKEEEKKYSTTAVATAAVHTNTNRIDTAISDSDSTAAAASTAATASSIISDQDLTESVDVWQDIADALNNWSERILSIESRYTNKVASFQKTIEESLARQQLDGFLNHQDVSELRYISSVWTNLLQATSCYTVGCISVKRDIITYLLELHTLGQIHQRLFIETCLQL